MGRCVLPAVRQSGTPVFPACRVVLLPEKEPPEEGGVEMSKMERDAAYRQCIKDAYAAALEIAKDDPDLLKAERDDFLDVMWPDDHDMKQRGLSREDYRAALNAAWDQLRQNGETNE